VRCTTPTATRCGRSPTGSAERLLVRASVPVRTCDIGGWSDTWFGGPGRVLNIATSPGIEVTVDRAEGMPHAGRDRLVQAALDEYPAGAEVDVRVSSGVPAGSALGTSSSLAVALIGALTALRGDALTPADAARAAHRLETEVLGEECGLQDQIAASYGGISYIEVDNYPDAVVESLPHWAALNDVISTVYLGQPHVSSRMHREIIERGDRGALEAMRTAAGSARQAVLSQDLQAFAEAVRENAQAQLQLHPDIVGRNALEAIDLARSSGALAWKVNGAGGDGGSLAVVHESPSAREAFEDAVQKTARWRVLRLQFSAEGLAVELNPPGS